MRKGTPVWQISIELPNGKKLVKTNCSLEQLFDTYFIKLDSIPKSENIENILRRYDQFYSTCRLIINYIDSWGHRWTGKVAIPKKEKFITYLKNKNYECENNSKNH